MPICVYGMSHATAPLPVRERVAFPADALGAAASRLVRRAGVDEGLVLSTCNRTEIVARLGAVDAARAGDGAPILRAFLSEERGVESALLDRHCYYRAGGEAVRHVFRTAASLDSMVVGEAQILGQIKAARAVAAEAGALGGALDVLLQRAFAAARRARRDTGIARLPVSIASTAAGLARDIFGDLRQSTVLVVGAGKMARLAAHHIIRDGVRALIVTSRTPAAAEALAGELGGGAVPFADLLTVMEGADIVITSTASPVPVVPADAVRRVGRARRGRPIFFIDIAVPRDVDPQVHAIDNVYLYDLDDLQAVARAGQDGRRREAAAAEAIVEREAEAFCAWLRARDVAPAIVDLRRRFHAIGRDEVARFRGRLGPLSEAQQRAVEDLAASLLNKVLHHPILALKRAAAADGAAHDPIGVLRQAFGLDEEAPRDGAGAGAAAPAADAEDAAPAAAPSAGPGADDRPVEPR